MRSFKQYITEIGDTSYNYTKKKLKDPSSKTHEYLVKHPTDENKDTSVVIHHDSETLGGPVNNAEITFFRKNVKGETRNLQTNDMTPSESAKVFSTIHNVVKDHAANHPGIKSYFFSSDKNEKSRNRLYKSFTNKIGGSSEDMGSYTNHSVKRKNLIGEE